MDCTVGGDYCVAAHWGHFPALYSFVVGDGMPRGRASTRSGVSEMVSKVLCLRFTNVRVKQTSS